MHTRNHPNAAARLHAAKVAGGERRACATASIATSASPAAYTTTAAATPIRRSVRQNSPYSRTPPQSSTSALLAVPFAVSDARVPSTVGQNRMKVPTTVNPTQPSRLKAMWAGDSRSCTLAGSAAWAMITPMVTPTARERPAAT